VRYGSADRLGPEHVGARVTVRRRLPDGFLSDVIGTLESFGPAHLSVRDRRGELVEIAFEDVKAARVHPAPAG
jgi:ribosome maturation factor RimP